MVVAWPRRVSLNSCIGAVITDINGTNVVWGGLSHSRGLKLVFIRP